MSTRMDSYPQLPSHQPPPIPMAGGPQVALNSMPHHQLPRRQLQPQAQLTPVPNTTVPHHDSSSEIIPDLLLYDISRQQYRAAKLHFDRQNGKKISVISLLESSEQQLERAKSCLLNLQYEKAAVSFIKGFTLFKFTERLNRDPSYAEEISTLRSLFSDGSFEKLKDIVDDIHVTEAEREARKVQHLGLSSSNHIQNFTLSESIPQRHDPVMPQIPKPTVVIPTNQPVPHAYYQLSTANHESQRKAKPPSIPVPPLPKIITNNDVMERPRLPPPIPTQSTVKNHYHQVNDLNQSLMPRLGHSICGLQNFSNTCYMNSLIQCLYNLEAFSFFFQHNVYTDYVHQVEGPTHNICLSYGLGSLFRVMDKHDGSTIAPNRFFSFLLAVSNFQSTEQQDVQEALLIVLNRLHEELSDNNLTLINFPKLLTPHSEDPEYDKWFKSKLEKEKLSPINNYFEGQQETKVQCQTCGFVSKSFSCFNVLSLNLPEVAGRDINLVFTIEELISLYTSKELMHGIDSWKCPECQKSRDRLVELEKQQILAKHELEIDDLLNNTDLGDIFENLDQPRKTKRKLFFKRKALKNANTESESIADVLKSTQDRELQEFEQRTRAAASSMVSVRSTHFLSLPSYLVVHVQRSVKGARLSSRINYPLILEVAIASNHTVRYKLQSTINHNGNSPNSGHYTAMCNKSIHLTRPNWCLFNDEVFHRDMIHGDIQRGFSRIISHDVYLLFYERIHS